jgi:hypothetical protein
MLERQFQAGEVDERMILQTLAEFDAAEATARLPIYALVSTALAAVSAIASALAAYFAPAALHVPHN